MNDYGTEIRRLNERVTEIKKLLCQAVDVIEQQSLMIEYISNHLELDMGLAQE